MIIVLKQSITADEKKAITAFLGKNNFKTNEINGEETTVLAAVGKLKVDPREVEVLPGVERVIPISKPYKMASREFKNEDTVVQIPTPSGGTVKAGGKRIVSIAGPCAVESREQMMAIAKQVAASGAVMLRGGAYKPRTSPYSFQGLGEEGLILLKEAGDKYGLPVVTEVVAAEYLPVMEKHGVDVYQVGARNMQNFELLKRLGALGRPVILKRGLAATIEEWLMSAEYLLSSGTDKVILCERGIRTYERATRNTLDLSAIPVLRSMTHLPIIVDPSHALGIRDKVPPMALAAVASGADGIIVEVHCNPDKALSDGPQSLLPEQFDKLMRDIEALAPVIGKAVPRLQTAASQREMRYCKGTERQKQSSPLRDCHEPLCGSRNDTAIADARNDESAAISQPTCAFSGKRGAYAESAIDRLFDGAAEAVAVDSFRGIFQAVCDGKTDYGMVPIENTLAGSVYENYDNLSMFEDTAIVGAVHLRIQHSLLGVKGSAIEDIRTVYSHPQAISQCSRFLSGHTDWSKVDCVSTATAAAQVARMGDKTCAAIASASNASYYGFDVLQDALEDNPSNYTRFVLIARRERQDALGAGGRANMASYTFCTKNEPGALCNCLAVFRDRGMNLTRLESRPVMGEPWRYRFYADAEVNPHGTDDRMSPQRFAEETLDALKSSSSEEARLLGVYAEAAVSI